MASTKENHRMPQRTHGGKRKENHCSSLRPHRAEISLETTPNGRLFTREMQLCIDHTLVRSTSSLKLEFGRTGFRLTRNVRDIKPQQKVVVRFESVTIPSLIQDDRNDRQQRNPDDENSFHHDASPETSIASRAMRTRNDSPRAEFL